MAEPVYLFLKVRGVTVEGDSLETSLGRENSIECLYYRQGVALPTISGMVSGRPKYEPLVIRKRIDKSSPVLANALTANHLVEGAFKFFRPSPVGDGTTEHYYTTEITQGHIVAVTQFVTDVEEPGELPDQPFEEITFIFNRISWTWTKSGVTTEVSGLDGVGGFSSGSAAGGAAAPASGSSDQLVGGLAPPVAAPEPFRGTVAEPLRRSRVAAIVPLTEAEASAGPAGPG